MLFDEMYRSHYRDVLRYALVLTRNDWDAQDIVAETFLRAWDAWQAGREPVGTPLPWLFTIARHLATDRWRRLQRALPRGTDRLVSNPMLEAESRAWLQSLCGLLPERQREVIVLRYDHDLPDSEIGRVMRLSESGVRSLAARALGVLRAHPEVWR